ncbi:MULTISPECIES: endonuclease/exonuclease/phosphatase family protein [unclassified Robiginitalea]|uniref:endonuclease/exonuclease/phosphatase family protein n=1 Tax=Robiginitalea TaxID=252306 RepID=UPI0023491548|nr:MULTISPECIES: endonuclease/exonuclease/phosphatase family protein [unclassified Robiginitalea]MDC6352991.1 endonuclease/exonuclease/phosphatase family protein [Robiginitalea sp. PM2]MDC6373842.1 endonuclease/exonuclease/phosphatase family protein [Robiginitalea sp. SP8]
MNWYNARRGIACVLLGLLLRGCFPPGLPAPESDPAPGLSPGNAREQEGLTPGHYRIRTLAFYNVENLFDTRDDSLTADDSRTPEGEDRWTEERYRVKLRRIAGVLSDIGRETAMRSPDLIGLCEVENREVLEDLLGQEALRTKGYGVVHYDSPDRRGIDVAFLYKKACFTPIESTSRRLLLYDTRNRRRFTRDQLLVYGALDGEPVYLSVNHWPSRSGGVAATEAYRRAAASLQRDILDSVLRLDPNARFVSMGDYNDDPTDASIRFTLGSGSSRDSLASREFFNPMEPLFLAGSGSLAYGDRWNLFDQLMFNGNWFRDTNGYRFWKARVFRPDYLLTSSGPYKGYPFRTYAGGSYQGGYSDHLPVYAFLIRKEIAANSGGVLENPE